MNLVRIQESQHNYDGGSTDKPNLFFYVNKPSVDIIPSRDECTLDIDDESYRLVFSNQPILFDSNGMR